MLLHSENSVMIQLGTPEVLPCPVVTVSELCTPTQDEKGVEGSKGSATRSTLGMKVWSPKHSDKPLDLLRVKGIQHKWWRREG